MSSKASDMVIIYVITNLVNDKVYVGQTARKLKDRWRQHIWDSKRKPFLLYRAMRKYGLDKFDITPICSAISPAVAGELESYFIKKYDSFLSGYNMTSGGERCVQSEEMNKRKSASLKASWVKNPVSRQTPESIKKIRETMTGRPSHRKGKTLSDETRKKMSEARKGSKNPRFGKQSPMKGAKLTPEARQKISVAKKLFWQKRRESHVNIYDLGPTKTRHKTAVGPGK